MILQVPETMVKVLWEGPMEPATEAAVEKLTRDWKSRSIMEDAHDAIRNLPIASIGQPEVWRLEDIYPTEKMPRRLQAKLAEAKFYLVRLACSFRPLRKEHKVEWARFMVHLLADEAGRQPIAFDLYPGKMVQEVKRNIGVTLSPELKFQEVEAKAGELAFGLEYSELQPIICAAGHGEANPNWDFEEAKGVTVQGGKWMHLLLKIPQEMETVRAFLDLSADVKLRHSVLGLLAISDKEKAYDCLTVRLV